MCCQLYLFTTDLLIASAALLSLSQTLHSGQRIDFRPCLQILPTAALISLGGGILEQQSKSKKAPGGTAPLQPSERHRRCARACSSVLLSKHIYLSCITTKHKNPCPLAHGTSLGTSNRLFRHDMTCASPDDFTSTAAFRVGVEILPR